MVEDIHIVSSLYRSSLNGVCFAQVILLIGEQVCFYLNLCLFVVWCNRVLLRINFIAIDDYLKSLKGSGLLVSHRGSMKTFLG